MSSFKYLLIIFIGVFTNIDLQAQTTQVGFVELELPPLWSCRQDEEDFVCQPDNINLKSEIIAIISSKGRDPIDDTLDKYRALLSEVRELRDLSGRTYNNEIKYTRDLTINQQTWIDSLQLSSEIPTFYTRYLATHDERLAGMLSFHINQSAYPKYTTLIETMIQSLKITQDQNAIQGIQARTQGLGLLGSGPRFSKGFTRPDQDEVISTKSKDSEIDPILLFQAGVVLLIVLGILFYLKRRRRKYN